MKPTDLYVIVIHMPTKRAFTLDRGYNLLTPLVENAYPAMFGELEPGEKWEGWVPSYEHQRPEWANEIIAFDQESQFTAWWYKAANAVKQEQGA